MPSPAFFVLYTIHQAAVNSCFFEVGSSTKVILFTQHAWKRCTTRILYTDTLYARRNRVANRNTRVHKTESIGRCLPNRGTAVVARA